MGVWSQFYFTTKDWRGKTFDCCYFRQIREGNRKKYEADAQKSEVL